MYQLYNIILLYFISQFLFLKPMLYNIIFIKTLKFFNFNFQKSLKIKIESSRPIHAIQYMFNFRVTGQEKNESEQ